MEIPKGVNLEGADCKDYVLESLKNLYGQKQAGHVLYNHLVNRLLELGFVHIAQQMNVSSIITAASYLSMLMIQFFWDQMEKS